MLLPIPRVHIEAMHEFSAGKHINCELYVTCPQEQIHTQKLSTEWLDVPICREQYYLSIQSQSHSYFTTDSVSQSASQSVSQYVLVSGTPLGPMTRFYSFLSFAGKLLCSSS
jgi:hypothetical protein